MLRAAVVAIVLTAMTLGAAAADFGTRRFENRVAGYTLELPAGWHIRIDPTTGAATVGTFAASRPGDVGERLPPGETSVILGDDGPIWALPRWARTTTPLSGALPEMRTYEGFTARMLRFRAQGHVFTAYVEGAPRTRTTLRILASIALTARGRLLANVSSVRVIGRSVQGRPLRAWRRGNPRSHRRILIVGCIHGDECAGMAITARLVDLVRPTTADLWVIQDLNPDGLHAATRQNAHGVDLNRNFGAMWQPIGRLGSRQYSGHRPFSEPESRAARALILRLRPQITIWFHQPQAVVRAWGPSVSAARRFARLAGAPYRSLPWLAGTAPNWQNHLGLISFVVELPPGPLETTSADRYASAILRLAEE